MVDALRKRLRWIAGASSASEPATPPWMSAFGGLRHLREETKRINQVLEREFEQIEEDEWR